MKIKFVKSAAEPRLIKICGKEYPAILSLPAIYRDPMALYCLYEESPGRIAALLGISEQAVRSRIRRGRALLKKTLGKEFGE